MSAIFDFPLSSETLAEDELTAITGTPMAVLSTFFYARAHFFAQTHCQLHEDDPQAGGMEIASGA